MAALCNVSTPGQVCDFECPGRLRTLSIETTPVIVAMGHERQLRVVQVDFLCYFLVCGQR